MPLTPVTTFYLEMLSPLDLRPKRSTRSDVDLVRVDRPSPSLNRYFFTTVGADWYWIERLAWTHKQWLTYLDRPEQQTWMLTVAGVPAGYFELEAQPGDNVEIVYFGLLPQYVGEGLGGHHLTCCIERAWAMAPKRVWVHTCNLDHPRALANYLARGFRLFKEETTNKDLPPQPSGYWPGC